MSVIAPFSALSVPSIHLSNDECQEILNKLPSTIYVEKFPAKLMVKFPDDITLTLYQAKFQKNPLVIQTGYISW